MADGHQLFFSSANLTSYAFDLNMEPGLLVTGGSLPVQVEDTFDRLIASQVIQEILLWLLPFLARKLRHTGSDRLAAPAS